MQFRMQKVSGIVCPAFISCVVLLHVTTKWVEAVSHFILSLLVKINSKFDSLTALRVKLIDEFEETVPDTVNFNVGYFDGRQQAKLWLVTNKDLESMYSKYRTGEITLWCDGRSDRDRSGEEVRSKQKRDSEASASRRQERE